jgi:hypothetical protein
MTIIGTAIALGFRRGDAIAVGIRRSRDADIVGVLRGASVVVAEVYGGCLRLFTKGKTQPPKFAAHTVGQTLQDLCFYPANILDTDA